MTRDVSRLEWLWWVTLLLVIGPIWTVQRDIWDGIIGAYGLDRGTFAGIHDWLIPGNWGLLYLIFRGVGWLSDVMPLLPSWFWVKLLLSAGVVGLSYETRRLCSDLLGWDARDSRAAGLLALAFPCWYLLYGSTFVYLVFVWWVFLGHRWMHSAGPLWRHVAGLCLVLASFQVNSNFVMVFALEGARWLCRDRAQRWLWWRSALVMGCAVVVYLALRLLLPPSGTYAAGYNNLIWPTTIAGLLAWLRAALMFLTWTPLIVGPAFIGWLLVRRAGAGKRQQPDTAGWAVVLLAAGALFAYMAVGKGAPLFVVNLPLDWLGAGQHLGRATDRWFFTTVDGWSTRHTFLFSVPAAMTSLWLIRRAVGAAPDRRAWWIAVGCALALDLGWMAHGHAAKLSRLAQEESIVRAMQQRPAPPPGNLDVELSPAPGWTAWTYEANYWTWLAYRRAAWAVAAYPAGAGPQEPALLYRREAVTLAAAGRDYYLLTDYPRPAACQTRWHVVLPSGLGGASLWLDRLGVAAIPPAAITDLGQNCG